MGNRESSGKNAGDQAGGWGAYWHAVRGDLQAIRWALATLDDAPDRGETLEAIDLIIRVMDRFEARPQPTDGSTDQD